MTRACITRRHVYAALAWVALAAPLSGCSGDHVKPSYSKSSLEPVVVTQLSASKLQVQFNEPMESMYYAAGMSYVVEGDTMKICVSPSAYSITTRGAIKGIS